jgi:SAM-dependent methyltransferase
VTRDGLLEQVRDYYDAKLRAFGPTPAGVDWKSRESQEMRFRQLAKIWEGDPSSSLLDYGCGYGALARWLRAGGHNGAYVGFDVSTEMIRVATVESATLPDCLFTSDRARLGPADYAVASGIFNVKMDTPDAQWREYVLTTIADLARLGRRGFALNALTAYSDPPKRRPDLYYADPRELFDHCKRTYGPFVALLHDYPLYEFTLIVRRGSDHG